MGIARMMCRVAAVTAVLAAGTCWAAEKVDNPLYKHWSKFKPGTSVTLKSESDYAGNKNESETTTTLLEVTADKVVVETKMSMNAGGNKIEMPANKMEFAAKTDKVDASAATTKPDIKESTEDVDVGGKKVKCKVVEMANDQNGMKTTTKSWTSEDVPGMVVKSETTMDGAMKGTSKMSVTAMTIK